MLQRSSGQQPRDNSERDDDSVPLIAAAAVTQLDAGQPVDTAAQEAVIQQFWHDKQQQDNIWRALLVFTAACLAALLLSLHAAPHYSLLHSSFTGSVEQRFMSPHAGPAVLALLGLSIAASLALTALIEPVRAAIDSPSLLWSPLFALSALLAAAVVSVAAYVAAAKTDSWYESSDMRWLWAVVYVACVLYWLVCVHSVTSTRGLGAEIRRLAKLKYSYHTA